MRLLLHAVPDLFWLISAWSVFGLFLGFYQQTFLATFCFILLHLWMQILMFEIRSFKPLRYTCWCDNWYKPWKSTKLGIFLILLDLKFTRIWTFNYLKKAPSWIFTWQIKRIAHDNFSVCSLNKKSF